MENNTEQKKGSQILAFFRDYFDLRNDKESEWDIVERIKKGIDFKGANIWILIIAIFIASLGLNVNSTAVIIGAMLISPLMGPIIGMGLSVGINDFELMKRSFKSYLVTTVFSIATAVIYFTLTPIAEAQSELLARTSPNIYDVLIALFGGLAGIVALSVKEKGNVIPGVAIATALMPPLCTAGYGIATGNLHFFLGAFYLYFINSLFISVSTFIGVRVMQFSRKNFVDKKREKRVRQYIIAAVIITMCPAMYLTVGIVKNALYESSAKKFINRELSFENTKVLDRTINSEDKEIKVILIGEDVPDESINIARAKLSDYNLGDTKLIVEGMNKGNIDVKSITSTVIEDLYKNTEKKLQDQQLVISQLERDMSRYKKLEDIGQNIVPELKVLYPSVKTLAIAHTLEVNTETQKIDTVAIAVMKFDTIPTSKEKNTITKWLSARVGAKKLQLIVDTKD